LDLLLSNDPGIGINSSLPNWSDADIGRRYSLLSLTIGNTNVLILIYRDPISTIGIILSPDVPTGAGNSSLLNFTAHHFFKTYFYDKFS
jgi:hypothetical protein